MVMDEGLIVTEEQHVKLKTAFQYIPYPDEYPDSLDTLVEDTGLDKEQVRSWFSNMRKRLGVDKVKSAGEKNDSGYLEDEEDIDSSVKESGICPLDYNSSVKKPKQSIVKKTEQSVVISSTDASTEESFESSVTSSNSEDTSSDGSKESVDLSDGDKISGVFEDCDTGSINKTSNLLGEVSADNTATDIDKLGSSVGESTCTELVPFLGETSLIDDPDMSSTDISANSSISETTDILNKYSNILNVTDSQVTSSDDEQKTDLSLLEEEEKKTVKKLKLSVEDKADRYDSLKPEFDLLKKQLEQLTTALSRRGLVEDPRPEQTSWYGRQEPTGYPNMYPHYPSYYNLPYPPVQPGTPYHPPYQVQPAPLCGQILPYPTFSQPPTEQEKFETEVLAEISLPNVMPSETPTIFSQAETTAADTDTTSSLPAQQPSILAQLQLVPIPQPAIPAHVPEITPQQLEGLEQRAFSHSLQQFPPSTAAQPQFPIVLAQTPIFSDETETLPAQPGIPPQPAAATTQPSATPPIIPTKQTVPVIPSKPTDTSTKKSTKKSKPSGLPLKSSGPTYYQQPGLFGPPAPSPPSSTSGPPTTSTSATSNLLPSTFVHPALAGKNTPPPTKVSRKMMKNHNKKKTEVGSPQKFSQNIPVATKPFAGPSENTLDKSDVKTTSPQQLKRPAMVATSDNKMKKARRSKSAGRPESDSSSPSLTSVETDIETMFPSQEFRMRPTVAPELSVAMSPPGPPIPGREPTKKRQTNMRLDLLQEDEIKIEEVEAPEVETVYPVSTIPPPALTQLTEQDLDNMWGNSKKISKANKKSKSSKSSRAPTNTSNSVNNSMSSYFGHSMKTSGHSMKTSGPSMQTSGQSMKTSGQSMKTSGHSMKTSSNTLNSYMRTPKDQSMKNSMKTSNSARKSLNDSLTTSLSPSIRSKNISKTVNNPIRTPKSSKISNSSIKTPFNTNQVSNNSKVAHNSAKGSKHRTKAPINSNQLTTIDLTNSSKVMKNSRKPSSYSSNTPSMSIPSNTMKTSPTEPPHGIRKIKQMLPKSITKHVSIKKVPNPLTDKKRSAELNKILGMTNLSISLGK